MSAVVATTESSNAQSLEGHDFVALLNKEFKPKTDQARDAVEAAVQTLAQQALASVTTGAAPRHHGGAALA